MKIQFVDIDEEYVIDTIDISNYDTEDENDLELLKKTIIEIINDYIEDNM